MARYVFKTLPCICKIYQFVRATPRPEVTRQSWRGRIQRSDKVQNTRETHLAREDPKRTNSGDPHRQGGTIYEAPGAPIPPIPLIPLISPRKPCGAPCSSPWHHHMPDPIVSGYRSSCRKVRGNRKGDRKSDRKRKRLRKDRKRSVVIR